MRIQFIKYIAWALAILLPSFSYAEPQKELRIGFVGSLSGFSADYGTAVLEGARLALDELNTSGAKLSLFVEDDQSNIKSINAAYQKLASINKIDALITGSWWANGIVKLAETSGMPFLSCETLFNDDAVLAPNYFLMAGDLRTWVRAFEPLIAKKGWGKGATIRFASGFSSTITREMEAIFSGQGRSYAGTIEYSDFQASDAPSIAVQLRKLAPQVVYIDGQPGGIANILRKIDEAGLKSRVAVLSHMAIEDLIRQKLLDPKQIGEVYFNRKETYREDFRKKFEAKYGRPPVLNADLGYYSAKILHLVLQQKKPVEYLKSGSASVDGLTFKFDEHNAYTGIKQEVWTFRDGEFKRVE